MTDATSEAESEHRLPAAYSQGFAHIRVWTNTNLDDVGPLAVPARPEIADGAEALTSDAPQAQETESTYLKPIAS